VTRSRLLALNSQAAGAEWFAFYARRGPWLFGFVIGVDTYPDP